MNFQARLREKAFDKVAQNIPWHLQWHEQDLCRKYQYMQELIFEFDNRWSPKGIGQILGACNIPLD